MSLKIFKDIDFLEPRQQENIQLRLLRDTLQRAYTTSPFYKKAFAKSGINPDAVKKLEDLQRLPFTTKNYLQKDNWAFLAVPRGKIAEIVATTGTTGEPVFIALTERDLERLAENEKKSFGYTGATPEDLFQIAVTSDNLFIAGMAYYRGLLRLGAGVVRIGPQNARRNLALIKKLKPTGIVAVPSFMVALARHAKEEGLSARNASLKRIVLIGESIRNPDFSLTSLGKLVEDAWGKKCFSTYGITEAALSFCECRYRNGLHSHPDLVIAEIVDDKGNPLKDGETGELVVTPLQVEGMPFIRYKTGDITFKISEKCRCGRTSLRIGPIIGRKHQRLKVKGVTLYPKTIENALLEIKDIINYQVEAYTGPDYTDHVRVLVGTNRKDPSFQKTVCDRLKAKARLTPEVKIMPPKEIEKELYKGGSRKALTFKDSRSGLKPGRSA